MKIAIRSSKSRRRGPLRAKASGKQRGRKKKHTNQSGAAAISEDEDVKQPEKMSREPCWIIVPELTRYTYISATDILPRRVESVDQYVIEGNAKTT